MTLDKVLLGRQCRRPFRRSFHNVTIPKVVTSWIDGEFIPKSSSDNNDSSYQNLSPFNGTSMCEVQPCTLDIINKAVESSTAAFRDSSWSGLGAKQRGQILDEMALVLKKNTDELNYLEAEDTGIPISQIRSYHIPAAIETLEYYAALSKKGFPGKLIQEEALTYTLREPYGVCAGIHGWNYVSRSTFWKNRSGLFEHSFKNLSFFLFIATC